MFWFTYRPFDQPEFRARTLGRCDQGWEATLDGFRRVPHASYPHLTADPEGRVEGLLLPLQVGDEWLLDAEFGVAQGYYRRQEVEVTVDEGVQRAWVLLGGPALAGVFSAGA